VLAVASVVGLLALFRFANPESLPEIEVRGECPPEAAEAFLDGFDHRLESVLDAMTWNGNVMDVSPGTDMAISTVRARRNELAAMDVPPCAQEALEAEVELATFVIDTLKQLRRCARPKVLCGAEATWLLSQGVASRLARIRRAHESIAEQTRIGLGPADIPP